MPLGLLPGATLVCDSDVDTVVTYELVKLKTDTVRYQLRQVQEAGFGSRAPAVTGERPAVSPRLRQIRPGENGY